MTHIPYTIQTQKIEILFSYLLLHIKSKTMSALANINSSAFANRIGLKSKRIMHRIVLVRHGESEANVSMMNNTYKPSKQNLNTPLSSLGHIQARNVADYLTLIGFVPDKIIVSRLARAMDTAKPFVSVNDIPVVYDTTATEYNYDYDDCITDEYGNWDYKMETKEEFINRVTEFLEHLKNGDTPRQTLIYTHSQVISYILSNAIYGIKTETNACFHLANGSITCLDIDEDGKFHIQAVNYTRHMDVPTGQHSPFV